MITFQQKEIDKETPLTPKQYAAAVDRLWRAAPFNSVKWWGATNEPDLRSAPKTKGPVYAAKIFKAIRSMARTRDPGSTVSHCPKCQIVAGEFSKDVKGGSSDTYVTKYVGAFKHPPHYWAFHTYDDIENSPIKSVDGKTYEFVETKRFIKNLDDKFHNARFRILLDEGGVRLRHGAPNSETRLYGNAAAQRGAARNFLRIGDVDPRIMLVAYYSVFGYQNGWDTAIVNPPTHPNPPPAGGLLQGKVFRPVYCILAGRPETVCDETSGK
jgi:hypothetical protein